MPIREILLSSVLDLILLLGIFILGSLFALLILRKTTWLDILSLGFPLGAGLLTFSFFLISLLGIHLTTSSVILLYFLSLGIVMTLLKWQRVDTLGSVHSLLSDIKSIPQRLPKGLVFRIGLGVFIGIFLFSVFLSVGRSYSIWDALETWSIKGYGIAFEGSVLAADRYGSFGRAYPLNLPILISIFRFISGDVLPGSKMIFPLLAGSFLVGAYRFWRRIKISREISILGVLLCMTIPLIFRHMMLGMADLSFACYFLLAVFWGIEGISSRDSRAILISGFLLSISCWTRAEGILYSVGTILTLLIAIKVTHKENPKIIPWLSPLIVFLLIWLPFSLSDMSATNLGQASRSSFISILEGRENLQMIGLILLHILRRSLDPTLWGFYFILSALIILSNWRMVFSKDDPVIFMCSLITLLAMVIPIGLFYFGMLHFGEDFLPGWLDRSFDRAFFSALLLFGNLALILIGRPFTNKYEFASNSE